MSKQTEALKLALEALEYISSHYMSLPNKGCMALAAVEEALAEQPAQQEQGDSNCQDDDGCPTEIAVLQRFWRGEPIPTEHYPAWFRPAQQQEPVAVVKALPMGHNQTDMHYAECQHLPVGTPLYTSPPAQQQQEPVATLWQHGETGRTRITMPDDITDCDARWFKAADLYTSPATQRKPLTDEEIYKIANDLFYGNGPCDTLAMCRAIEAAHGIKENT